MNDPAPKRRWFQFSLRTLFAVVTAAAFVCAAVPPIAARFLVPQVKSKTAPEKITAKFSSPRPFIVIHGNWQAINERA